MVSLAGITVTVVALAALLVGHATGSKVLQWTAKPLASAGFLAAAVGFGAFESTYGIIVFIALLFCFVGDVLLIPAGKKTVFALGLGSFLLGHLVLTVAFVERGLAPSFLAAGVAGMALVTAMTGRWLHSHVPGKLRGPVWAYLVVIGLMVASSAGVVGHGGPIILLLGAVAFAASDVAVARHRFVAPGFANKLWGLPLYYAAVLVLAYTVAV